MIEWFIPQGSSYAGHVDGVILLIGLIVGFWFFLTQGFFFAFILKYRVKDPENPHRADYITGKEKDLKRWISIPHAIIIGCDLVIVAYAVFVWYSVKQDTPNFCFECTEAAYHHGQCALPDGEECDEGEFLAGRCVAREMEGRDVDGDGTPEGAEEFCAYSQVRVIAQQWAWTFVHPGPDNMLDTDDDIVTVDELHLQQGRIYQYQLESRDVLHSFSVPIFRLKQDAIPGRRIVGWFQPTIVGNHSIQCAEICGVAHGIMGARVIIDGPGAHAQWIQQNSSNNALAAN